MSTTSEYEHFELHRRALACIAQGYLTNSKRPECFVKGVFPTHLKKGQGCYVWDYKGNRYIDFISSLGTNLLGYTNTSVSWHANLANLEGNLLSLGSEEEIKTAEKLKEVFQFVDCWKFLKTGNEATHAALKIARAYSKKGHLVLSSDFHGHGDEFNSLMFGIGVPNRDWIKPLSQELNEDEIAKACAVIIEPVVTDFSAARIKWLQHLRELCDKHSTLLIFDEIVTGFRFPKFCVANNIGIYPDIIVLGKAMANGYSLAAVGGKYHVMNCDDYFVSSTYSSSRDALVACQRVLHLLDNGFSLDELWESGEKFKGEFNKLYPEKITIEGYGTRGVFKGDEVTKALLFQEACRAGILFGPSWVWSFPLMEEAEFVLNTLKDIFYRIKSGAVKLEGELPKAALAQRARQS